MHISTNSTFGDSGFSGGVTPQHAPPPLPPSMTMAMIVSTYHDSDFIRDFIISVTHIDQRQIKCADEW